MSSLGKSLADQIAELTKPKKDFDIEAEDPFAQSDSDAAEEPRYTHYVKVGRSKMRDKLEVGDKYKGKKVTRAALYGSSDDDMEDLPEGSEGESQADDTPESSSDEQFEDATDGSGLDANLDNDSDPSLDHDLDADTDGAQKEQIKDIIQQEKKHILSRLSGAAALDALKGYALMQQHKVFDSLIDVRLKIQKALSNSNNLPVDAAAFKATKEKGDLKKVAEAKDLCYNLLDSILAFRAALHKSEGVSEELHTPKKRTLLQYLDASAKYDQVLATYRESVLTKWLLKIHNSSGASALNASKFKALNQLAEQQVKNNLADLDRLVKRTRLNRRKAAPIGYKREEKKQEGTSEDTPEQPDRGLNVEEMELIFDDEDFYRTLLNDLVDKKMQTSNATSGMHFAPRSSLTKLKKNVDTKASKGRKLRFHVQEPIANFETPKSVFKWDDDQIDEFFASLLGQKVSMEEEEVEEEVEVDDSIQLFG